MKKTLAAILLASCLAFALPSNAETPFPPRGGFKDSVAIVSTVKEAKEMNDDTYVTLRGNIEKRIKGDHYMFRDATGTIEIEIDDDKWHGLTVGPEDVVEILGEVDKGWMSTTIDVKSIAKVMK